MNKQSRNISRNNASEFFSQAPQKRTEKIYIFNANILTNVIQSMHRVSQRTNQHYKQKDKIINYKYLPKKFQKIWNICFPLPFNISI